MTGPRRQSSLHTRQSWHQLARLCCCGAYVLCHRFHARMVEIIMSGLYERKESYTAPGKPDDDTPGRPLLSCSI